MTQTNNRADFHGADGAAFASLELITSRRAGRRLLPDEVPADSILRILEAARWAPSCANNQPWKYYVCTGDSAAAVRQALLGGNYWADNAPVYLVAAVDRGRRGRQPAFGV